MIGKNVIPESSEGVGESKDESSLLIANSDTIHCKKKECSPFKPMHEDDGYGSEYSEFYSEEATIERM